MKIFQSKFPLSNINKVFLILNLISFAGTLFNDENKIISFRQKRKL